MKIAVIMGGISSEREVSLDSGNEIYKYLDKEKHDVSKVILNTKSDILEKLDRDTDFAFLALHGKYGEDGVVQCILDSLDIPYSGCNPLTSGILMDKNYTKIILHGEDLPTAPWIVVKSTDKIDYDKIDELGYPVFIKPNSGGSSVATFKVKSKEEVEEAVRNGLEVDECVMIEKYVNGVEHTSFVLNGEVFPTIRIVSDQEFYDYEAKYSDDHPAHKEIVKLDKDLQEEINSISKKCWDIFNCNGYVRVDFIVDEENKPYVLELNTLPGMTSHSLIPMSARSRGIEYPQLLEKLMEVSLEENN